MGNKASLHTHSPLKAKWSPHNTQTFTINSHKNKIFGCDVITPYPGNSNELWVATCSADGRIIINEVTLFPMLWKEKSRSSVTTSPSTSVSSTSSTRSKSSSLSSWFAPKHGQNTTPRVAKFHIEQNRLFTIPLDSNICYTLTFHRSARYIATCVNKTLFIYEIDTSLHSPIFQQINIAKKYLSGAKFIDERHIIFSSGDGNVYIYNFMHKRVISTITPKKYYKNRDVLCFDHANIKCLDKRFGKQQIIAFATINGEIYIYDITNVMNNASDLMVMYNTSAVLIQKMKGQFGADISCLSISSDARFIAIGSEDNSYNIYHISVRTPKSNNYVLDVRWILLRKQILWNDANIVRVAWITNTTVIASCDQGKLLYLSGIYEVKCSQMVVGLLSEKLEKVTEQMYTKNEMRFVMSYIIDVILEYVKWIILHHSMSVEFEDHISCIATCPNVNSGTGFVAVGGFSKTLQCFVPLT